MKTHAPLHGLALDTEDCRTLREEIDVFRTLQKIRNKYELTLLLSPRKNKKYLRLRTTLNSLLAARIHQKTSAPRRDDVRL